MNSGTIFTSLKLALSNILYAGFVELCIINNTQATTTVGGCTPTFDGTSASCPVTSAVIALALEVK